MGETRGWRPVHVGLILTVVGLALIGVSWYVAVQTNGLLVRWESAGGGPFVLIHGLSQLVFPREWAGPDGNGIHISWRAEVVTLVLGLIAGVANLFAIKALIG